MRMSVERALASGLTIRPIRVTLKDTMDWYRKQPANWQAEFLSVQVEKQSGTGFERMTIPWDVYLAREKKMLATWSATAASRMAK